MFSLFTDDELQGMDYWVSSYFNRFSYNLEMLNKAMDLFISYATIFYNKWHAV